MCMLCITTHEQEQLRIAELALSAMMRDTLLLKHLILHMHGGEAIPLSEDVVQRLQPFLVCMPMHDVCASPVCHVGWVPLQRRGAVAAVAGA